MELHVMCQHTIEFESNWVSMNGVLRDHIARACVCVRSKFSYLCGRPGCIKCPSTPSIRTTCKSHLHLKLDLERPECQRSWCGSWWTSTTASRERTGPATGSSCQQSQATCSTSTATSTQVCFAWANSQIWNGHPLWTKSNRWPLLHWPYIKSPCLVTSSSPLVRGTVENLLQATTSIWIRNVYLAVVWV